MDETPRETLRGAWDGLASLLDVPWSQWGEWIYGGMIFVIAVALVVTAWELISDGWERVRRRRRKRAGRSESC